MGDRIALQTDKTELSPQVLLRGKRKCHQDTDLGDTHSQPPVDAHEERADTSMEFLGAGDNDPDNVDVLCGLLQPVQPSGKGLGGHAEIRAGRAGTVGTFHIEGLDGKVNGVKHD